jgi:hypothetical protein
VEGDSSTGGEAALQPRGEVVGILQRWSGEVVACISEEDERALAAKRQNSGRQVGRWGAMACFLVVCECGAARSCTSRKASQRRVPGLPLPPLHSCHHMPAALKLQEAVLCVPIDRRLPKIRLRSRQLHRLLGQVRTPACRLCAPSLCSFTTRPHVCPSSPAQNLCPQCPLLLPPRCSGWCCAWMAGTGAAGTLTATWFVRWVPSTHSSEPSFPLPFPFEAIAALCWCPALAPHLVHALACWLSVMPGLGHLLRQHSSSQTVLACCPCPSPCCMMQE